MPRSRRIPGEDASDFPKSRPPITLEARDNMMINLAVNLAEKQLRDGTASSQVITHYLKLGSAKEQYERIMMQKNIELMEAKTQKINSEKKNDELYERVVNAMREYSGLGSDHDDSDI